MAGIKRQYLQWRPKERRREKKKRGREKKKRGGDCGSKGGNILPPCPASSDENDKSDKESEGDENGTSDKESESD
ncbi:hypothetical protein KY285_035534 [Solanum tuberosum]|nr:hypothetical protein KY285_035534 [Solanum tuberosum]